MHTYLHYFHVLEWRPVGSERREAGNRMSIKHPVYTDLS